MHRSIDFVAGFACAAAALVGGPVLAQAVSDPELCELETTERIVAVGDVHGAYDEFVAILREAAVIDHRQRWIGGRTVLVQTGDVLDRGPASRQVIDLLGRLEREARRAGGAVYSLLGNHELMRVLGDWRYVSQGEYEAFSGRRSAALRAAALARAERDAVERASVDNRPLDLGALRADLEQRIPLGALELAAAFGPDGRYGRWIRERPAVVNINDILFVHGGISPALATRSCADINAAVAAELEALGENASSSDGLGNHEAGPLWYRGLVTEPEDAFETTLEEILDRMDVRAIVVGHTTMPGRVTARFGGRVLAIDTGMLAGDFYPRGAPAAVELRGTAVTAVYLDGQREPLPPLTLESTAPP